MEVKPGYKQTDIGALPGDWRVAKIKDVASITTGKRNTQDRIEDGLYPFFVRSQTVERINSFSFDGEAVLTAGDGVGTGKVFHYINGKFDFHQRVYKLADFSADLNGFFFHLYFSTHFYDRIMSMTAKSSVDSVRLETIAGMQIPLPPLPEQRAIAGALSDVDALLGALDQLIAKKRDLKQAAMQRLLTGQIRLPGFHGEWAEKCLGDVIERLIGGGTPSRANPAFWGNEIPWVTVKDFATFHPLKTQEAITKEGLKQSASHLIPAGTLITSTRMALGNAVIYAMDVAINQDLKALFLRPNANVRFVYYWFEHHAKMIDELGSGSTVKGISIGDLKGIPFRLTSVAEQTAIAGVLSDMDAELAALEQRRAKTRALKQGMMQELLTGRTRLI
jgi:type I restriction enzyme S subunit